MSPMRASRAPRRPADPAGGAASSPAASPSLPEIRPRRARGTSLRRRRACPGSPACRARRSCAAEHAAVREPHGHLGDADADRAVGFRRHARHHPAQRPIARAPPRRTRLRRRRRAGGPTPTQYAMLNFASRSVCGSRWFATFITSGWTRQCTDSIASATEHAALAQRARGVDRSRGSGGTPRRTSCCSGGSRSACRGLPRPRVMSVTPRYVSGRLPGPSITCVRAGEALAREHRGEQPVHRRLARDGAASPSSRTTPSARRPACRRRRARSRAGPRPDRAACPRPPPRRSDRGCR